MADGAVMMGLPRELAVEHAAATVRGAATMVATVSIIDRYMVCLSVYLSVWVSICLYAAATIRGAATMVAMVSIIDR